MTDEASFKKALKDRIASAVRQSNVNHAAAVNVGRGRSHTSVSTRQTVTQRDGRTEVTEIREETRSHPREQGGGEANDGGERHPAGGSF